MKFELYLSPHNMKLAPQCCTQEQESADHRSEDQLLMRENSVLQRKSTKSFAV